MTESSSPRNRRNWPRYLKSIPFQLFDEKFNLVPGELTMVDVSLGGIAYRNSIPGIVGKEVNFRLNIPGQGVLSGIATTRWTFRLEDGGFLSGIRFESLSRMQEEKLRGYLNPRAKRGSSES